MLFAVRFEDDQTRQETRKQYLEAHVEWLGRHVDTVLIGGSLRNEPEYNPVGGLWIVRAESKEAVEKLIETDPFWQHGLRISVEILFWSKAFEDREVLI